MELPRVAVFGADQDGRRSAQVDLPRFRVLVTPHDKEANKEAAEAAWFIGDRLTLVYVLKEQAAKLRAENGSLQSRLASALTGKRRLFGRVLLVAGKDGWGGEVWLQDPEKRDAGMALRFESLAECRQSHPELWPIGVADGCVLMDAWGVAG